MSPRSVLLSLLAVTGCESYVGTTITVRLDDAVLEAYDADAPGIVVTTVGPAAPLCGGDPDVVYASQREFGCLSGDEPESVAVGAWASPIPDDWDADAFCSAPFEEGWIGFHPPAEMDWAGIVSTEADFSVEGDAPLSTRFQGCGGAWLADLVLE